MSTESVIPTVAGGWLLVASAADDKFLVENQGSTPVLIHFATSLPASDAAGHYLHPKVALPRMAAGNIYVRSLSDVGTRLIVSK